MVAAVVAVFVWMLSFAAALDSSLSMASDARKIIILQQGATAEGNSAIPIEDYNRLSQLAGVARDPSTGEALISPEMLVQVQLPRISDQGRTAANVAIRGITTRGFQVHRVVVPPAGYDLEAGAPEVIVGAAAARQFIGLQVGQTIRLGYGNNREYKVAGIFTAGGGPLESEIWGYLPSLMNAYNRTMYSSATLRLADDADAGAVIAQIAGPAIELVGQTEAAYWQEQSKPIRIYLGIAYGLVAVMCVAAVFSIANTMFSAVAGRTREIAMLRTIGFSGRQVLSGFLLEAVLLSLIGGACGVLACQGYLLLAGNTKDMFGANTFTTMAFEIHVVWWVVVTALTSVSLVGVLGAFVPALRGARIGVVSALREA